jgi:hypothetical protein
MSPIIIDKHHEMYVGDQILMNSLKYIQDQAAFVAATGCESKQLILSGKIQPHQMFDQPIFAQVTEENSEQKAIEFVIEPVI